MKKSISLLMAGLLALSSAALSATVNSNKTVVTPRDTGSYSVLFPTATSFANKKKKTRFNADVSLVGFYSEAFNTKELGKYFGGGIDDNASKPVNGTIQVAKSDVNEAATQSLLSSMIEHDHTNNVTGTPNGMHGVVNLAPTRRVCGSTLTAKVSLDEFMQGAWVEARASVVNVETNLTATTPTESKSTATNGLNGKGLLSYFDGTGSGTYQNALTKSKIRGKKNETGVPSVTVRAGYTAVQEDDMGMDLSLRLDIPTGNKVTGEYAFEPVYGKGGDHFALGAGLNGHLALWQSDDKKQCVSAFGSMEYAYTFEAKQARTLGLYNHATGNIEAAGQYRLAIKSGHTNVKATPLANVLNREVIVTPGSSVETVSGLMGKHGNFTWSAAYNAYAREAEDVQLTENWLSDTWAQVASDFNTTGTITTVGTNSQTVGGPIQEEGRKTSALTLGDLNTATYYVSTKAAASPDQIMHGVTGTVGYNCNRFEKFPLRVALGGHAEFGHHTNNAIDTWTVFANIGMCF